MAISAPHYAALKLLADKGEFTPNSRILEIGEANYYGDFPIRQISEDIDARLDGDEHAAAIRRLKQACVPDNQWGAWLVVKVIYDLFIRPFDVVSIDFDGTPAAIKLDLNRPLTAQDSFDVVINHGTAEHIFSIANVFKVMHDSIRPGGLMIHESPFTGWVDHGFYTLQPTLFFDVAKANDYEIRFLAIEHIETNLLQPIESREQIHRLARDGKLPDNAMLFVALRKTTDAPFKIPIQGVYARTVSSDVQQAWRKLR